ncbi:hypothetical protein pb186bvf_001003 [Paramecium bursaria]
MKTERDSHVSSSYFNELSEKERLTKLIYQSMQNPKNMEVYLDEFIKTKKPQSSNISRHRVNSQPQLDQRLKRKTEQQTPNNNRISRRCSVMHFQTSPKTPNKSKSPPNKAYISLHSMNKEKQNINISKLSTNALIKYHKNLVVTAQKLLCKNKRK